MCDLCFGHKCSNCYKQLIDALNYLSIFLLLSANWKNGFTRNLTSNSAIPFIFPEKNLIDPNSTTLDNVMMKAEILIKTRNINVLNMFGVETRSFKITGNGKGVKADMYYWWNIF